MASPADDPGGGPLAGLRVIEVSSYVAAPLGGMTLAQLGAAVIRVDPLGGGADSRRWPLTSSGASLYWAGLNKGKRSLMVDMRSAAGRQLVTDLVAKCPTGTAVLLTNAIGREWLSYRSLSAVCPDLVHVQVQGRGDGASAVDYTVNAEVGFPLVTGPEGHAGPVNHVLPSWDIACGLYAALAVSAAARHRALTGEGAQVSVALSDVALAMAGNLGFLAEAQINKVDRPRIGNHLYGGFARDFGCRDGGRLMIVALTGRHWHDLVAVTGTHGPVVALETALGADFSTEDDRYEYREVLAGLIERWFAARTTAEASAALAGTSLVWAPYRSFTETVAHLRTPEGASRVMSVIDQPGVGPHLAPGSPLVFGDSPGRASPAPLLGQHSAQVLADDLGLSAEQIAALLAHDVVAPAQQQRKEPSP